jgi:hypothetical protein
MNILIEISTGALLAKMGLFYMKTNLMQLFGEGSALQFQYAHREGMQIRM